MYQNGGQPGPRVPILTPQKWSKMSYLSNNGPETSQTQTNTYMNGSRLTIKTFWYYLHVKVSKWQATRAQSPHFDQQKGPKMSYIYNNCTETSQNQTKPYMSESRLTIKTYWYYLHVNVSKWQATRAQSPHFDPQKWSKMSYLSNNGPETAQNQTKTMSGSLLTIKTYWYYLHVNVSNWWAARAQSLYFDPQKWSKMLYLSNNGPETSQNQTNHI